MDMKKVIVGMSGGVDSSTAAYLLKQQGYEVIGLTAETWCEGDDFSETGDSHDIRLAREAAERIGIPHKTVNLKKEFRETVVEDFISEYRRGRTPNPCVLCNRTIKWKALQQAAEECGADYVATGHYAKVDRLPNGRLAIRNSASAKKDQTYVLWQLTQEQLSNTLFPVGDYEKDQVRAIASEAGLPAASIPDSQEICFVPGTDYAGFLKRTAGDLPEGNFVDAEGKVLGRHKGLWHYTIGQRKGLGIALGRPVFVTELRPDRNEVVLGDEEALFVKEVKASRVRLMALESLREFRCKAKVRYAKKAADCVIRPLGEESLLAVFDEPQRAPTPGQSLVFYEGDYVAGGGLIL